MLHKIQWFSDAIVLNHYTLDKITMFYENLLFKITKQINVIKQSHSKLFRSYYLFNQRGM